MQEEAVRRLHTELMGIRMALEVLELHQVHGINLQNYSALSQERLAARKEDLLDRVLTRTYQ